MEKMNRVLRLRSARNLTQKELAEKAGLTYRAIQNYEYTSRQPKGQYLTRLAKALGVPEEALLDDKECEKWYIQILTAPTTKNITATLNAKTKFKKLMFKSSSLFAGLGILSGIICPFATSFVAAKWLELIKYSNDIYKENSAKEIFKEQSRIEGMLVYLNSSMDSISEEYEQLAIKTQQEDADINEYKTFTKLSQEIANIQEYRMLLKQKSKLISLIIAEIEKNSGKNIDLIKHLISEITDIEKSERKYIDYFTELTK